MDTPSTSTDEKWALLAEQAAYVLSQHETAWSIPPSEDIYNSDHYDLYRLASNQLFLDGFNAGLFPPDATIWWFIENIKPHLRILQHKKIALLKEQGYLPGFVFPFRTGMFLIPTTIIITKQMVLHEAAKRKTEFEKKRLEERKKYAVIPARYHNDNREDIANMYYHTTELRPTG